MTSNLAIREVPANTGTPEFSAASGRDSGGVPSQRERIQAIANRA
jgi:hypothetical protein